MSLLTTHLLKDIIGLPPYWYALWQINRSVPQGERISYGSHARQYYVLHLPAEPPRGVLIYFHGGGWQFGSPEKFRAVTTALSELGLALVLPSYRRIPRYSFQDIHADMLAFQRHLSAVLQERNIARHQLYFGGMSAGGHLAALSVLDPSIRRAGSYRIANVSGLFLCGSVLDLDLMPPSHVMRALAGKRASTEWRQANPLAYLVQGELPPTLVIHSKDDGMVPYAAAQRFYTTACEQGCNCIDFHTLPTGGHLAAGRWLFDDDSSRRRLREFLA